MDFPNRSYFGGHLDLVSLDGWGRLSITPRVHAER